MHTLVPQFEVQCDTLTYSTDHYTIRGPHPVALPFEVPAASNLGNFYSSLTKTNYVPYLHTTPRNPKYEILSWDSRIPVFAASAGPTWR